MDRDLTFGELRVNSTFNPTENESVASIKAKCADIIDTIQALKATKHSDEQIRLLNLAQDEIEVGCMFAVKAIFK